MKNFFKKFSKKLLTTGTEIWYNKRGSIFFFFIFYLSLRAASAAPAPNNASGRVACPQGGGPAPAPSSSSFGGGLLGRGRGSNLKLPSRNYPTKKDRTFVLVLTLDKGCDIMLVVGEFFYYIYKY